MATEFHGLKLACSPGSVIPDGFAYTDIAYQSCAIAGSTPGSLTVSGDSYVAASFGYAYSNLWRNFGIMILFTIAFILLGAYFNEILEWSDSGSKALEFKSASKSVHRKAVKDEEEKAVPDVPSETISSASTITNDSSMPQLQTDRSTFTWKDLTYTIPYDGNTRTLLNGVSGYCALGQMTALVGSSGAGKTTCEYFHLAILPFLTFCSIEHSCTTTTRWHLGWRYDIRRSTPWPRLSKEDWILRADGHPRRE